MFQTFKDEPWGVYMARCVCVEMSQTLVSVFVLPPWHLHNSSLHCSCAPHALPASSLLTNQLAD